MKRIITIVIAVVVCVGVVCGGFYYVKHKADTSGEDNVELTKVQKITTRDLSADYPETPREVVKLFNKILVCYYNEKYTDDELKDLVGCAWELFDVELQENNGSEEEYLNSVKLDVADYKDRSRTISQTDVCDSNEVQYLTDGDDEIAYVSASYFIKENKTFNNTYEKYVLRKDADGRWKILVFYQIEGESSEEE